MLGMTCILYVLCCHQNEVTLLRNEVAQLKQLLLAHKDCPVTVMQKKAAFLGNHFGQELINELSCTVLLVLSGSIYHPIHLMYSFYSLTSLRVNVSVSVSSCRRRGNLQGYFH